MPPPAAASKAPLLVRAVRRLRERADRAGLPPELLAPELLFRQATAARRADPHFLIIGTQKGGTTTLYDDLTRHPHVLPAYEKEVHYFDHHYRRGPAWYRRHFPLRSTLDRRHAVTGEASPSYLYHPHAPRRIAADLPEVKMVVLLRDPVRRAVSQYWHMLRVGKETLPMAEAFRREPERLAGEHERILRDEHYFSRVYHTQSYRNRGLYADQLERYLVHFDRGQLLLLPSEEFFRDRQGTYDRVLDFLGLEPYTLPPLPARNKGEYKGETPTSVRDELAAFFRPHNERLFELLGVDTPWW